MSLGNINNNQPNKKLPNNKPTKLGVDRLVESLNNKIAFLLGKRNQQPNFNKKTSNRNFFIIISTCCLLLWFGTGVYYIAENQFGVILNYGKVVAIKHGVDAGFTLPYPLSKLEILDAKVSHKINFKNNSKHTSLVLLTSDLHPVNIDGNFSYQIDNPKQLYNNYLQQRQNLDEVILLNLQSSLHNQVARLDQKSLLAMKHANLQTILKDAVNQRLINYGVRVVIIKVLAVNQLDSSKPVSMAMSAGQTTAGVPKTTISDQSLATQILDQAYYYQTVEMQSALDNANKFSQLLVKYKLNPQPTVQEMYNEALSQIPIKEPNYSLLNLSLAQLLEVDKHLKANTITDLGRDFSRTVSRSRGLERKGRGGRNDDDTSGGSQE